MVEALLRAFADWPSRGRQIRLFPVVVGIAGRVRFQVNYPAGIEPFNTASTR
jgi:hypothetical protein